MGVAQQAHVASAEQLALLSHVVRLLFENGQSTEKIITGHRPACFATRLCRLDHPHDLRGPLVRPVARRRRPAGLGAVAAGAIRL